MEPTAGLVVVAYSGQSGLRLIEDMQPESVIVDLAMPEMTGLDVARAVRLMPGGENVRLIALTGLHLLDDARHVLTAGFDDYLIKPASLERLLEVLKVMPYLGSGSTPPGEPKQNAKRRPS